MSEDWLAVPDHTSWSSTLDDVTGVFLVFLFKDRWWIVVFFTLFVVVVVVDVVVVDVVIVVVVVVVLAVVVVFILFVVVLLVVGGVVVLLVVIFFGLVDMVVWIVVVFLEGCFENDLVTQTF